MNGSVVSDIQLFRVNDFRGKVSEILVILSQSVSMTPDELAVAINLCERALGLAEFQLFLESCVEGMTNCYLRAAKIKGNSAMKSMAVERNFNLFRFECQKSEAWKAVLANCSLVSGLASPCCLQHILQHIWSTVPPSSHNSTTDEVTQPQEPVDVAEEEDHLEDIGILYDAGWCIKRARDDIQKMPTVVEVMTTASDSILVRKEIVEEVINIIGSDMLTGKDGYMFVFNDNFLGFFKLLHDKCCNSMKQSLQKMQKDAVKKCFEELSQDKELRNAWDISTASSHLDQYKRAGLIIVLKNAIFFFLKSKQKSLCGKMHLGPDHNSVSLRQELRCAKKKAASAAKKAKIEGQNNGPSEERDPLANDTSQMTNRLLRKY